LRSSGTPATSVPGRWTMIRILVEVFRSSISGVRPWEIVLPLPSFTLISK
jgi:hypothetical protein